MPRQRINQKQLTVERQQILQFFFWLTDVKGFVPTRTVYKDFKRAYPKSKLTLMGFARMIPKPYKHGIKRVHGKLVRGVYFGKAA